MRNYNTSSQSQSQTTVESPRRESSRSNRNEDNRGRNNYNNNNNSNQRNFEKRKEFSRQEQPRDRSQSDRDRSSYRERSGQRSGQYPDSSMSRDIGANLGSVKFTPGLSTYELPPIETKADPSKKFTGRCRLFVGNLPHNTSQEQVEKLFQPFGEIGEVYLGPKSSFAFVKMDTRQNAEAARDALDCTDFKGRPLRVRLAAHACAIKVKNLSHVVTNELLAYAFRFFGEIERAVVIVDDKGKSTGEGIVEYSRKQSAQYAVKRCQQDCFLLTQEPRPVLVEAYDQHDEDEGLPEKSVNKNFEYKEQRDVGPRFAEPRSFEHTYAIKWKELYELEKRRRDALEQEILEVRDNLKNSMDILRLEHDTIQLKNKLQQLEDNRLKLQQLKEQTMGGSQQRDEQRRQQEMMLRQREEDLLRRQNYLNQQESTLQSQAHVLQDMMRSDCPSVEQTDQQKYQSGAPFVGQESDQSGMNVNTMLGSQALGASAPVRSFTEAQMLNVNYMQQTPMGPATIPVSQNQATVFTGYIPPPPLQGTMDDNQTVGSASFNFNQPSYPASSTSTIQQNQESNSNNPRQNKFNNSNNNSNNNNRHGNNMNASGNNPRPRKRGRF